MKLKFRVFNIEREVYLPSYAWAGEMFYFQLDDMRIGVDWFIRCERLESPTRFKVEQFSGLLDSEGKEVYEGDLVEVTYLDPDFPEEELETRLFNHGDKFIGEVTRVLGGSINLEVLVKKGEQTPFDIWFPLFYVEQGKVVGNILTKKD